MKKSTADKNEINKSRRPKVGDTLLTTEKHEYTQRKIKLKICLNNDFQMSYRRAKFKVGKPLLSDLILC